MRRGQLALRSGPMPAKHTTIAESSLLGGQCAVPVSLRAAATSCPPPLLYFLVEVDEALGADDHVVEHIRSQLADKVSQARQQDASPVLRDGFTGKYCSGAGNGSND